MATEKQRPPEAWLCSSCGDLAMRFRQAYEVYLNICGDLSQLETSGQTPSLIQSERKMTAYREAQAIDGEFRLHIGEHHPWLLEGDNGK